MKTHISKGFAVSLPIALLMTTALVKPALAACTSSSDSLTLNCSGALGIAASTLPITVYDAAAAFQPILGSNSYTPANPAFPAESNPANPGYDPNPGTVTLNFDKTVSAVATNPTSASLADKALVVANFSNSENPAVNNVVINNAGVFSLSTNQIAARMDAIVGDSQVNSFTVNNSGTVSVAQTFFSTFAASKLSLTSSGSPATVAAKYNGATLNDMAAFYSDDNTNSFTLNNANGGQILASGHFATGYYGRADTTIVNSGTIAHTDWTSRDTIAAGHWAIATWGGAEYTPAPNTNPDSTIVLRNADGSVTVQDTAALTLTNNAGGNIKGDILAMDVTPLVYAAAVGSSANPFANPNQTTLLQLPLGASNAGPRDSTIQNYGSIAGNLYLGSGTHVIDNAAGATLAGNVYVDQRPIQVSFATPNAGTETGTFLSIGGADFNGNDCPAAGLNSTNPGCAGTHNVLATVVGGQSLTLTNEGTLSGDIRLFDQASSVNSITLTGAGFTGNIVAINGTGSNSLSLNGVTNLASVVNFSALDLTTSRVTVSSNAATTTPGVSLVDGATIATTIYGPGGTKAAPSTQLGSINGLLTLGGATTITPTFTSIVRNGDVYQLASSFAGDPSIAIVGNGSALMSLKADTSSGALLLDASVVNANNIAGISKAGAATVNNLLSYGGINAKTQALGMALESLPTLAGVRGAAEQLRPSVNGASIHIPLAINNLFSSQISNRVDSSFYGALPDGPIKPTDFVDADLPAYKSPKLDRVDDGAWLNVVGSNISQQTVAAVSGYNANFGGLMGGYDHFFGPGLRLGAALGYASGNSTDSTLHGDSLNVQSLEGLVYGSLTGHSWFVNGSAGAAALNYTSTRTISFSGFGDSATASRSGTLYTARLEGGRPVIMSFGILVPVASLLYAGVDQNAYTEKSYAGAGLHVLQQDTDSLQSGLGLKAIIPFALSTSMVTAFEAKAIWQHEFLNTTEAVTASFASDAGSFQAIGPTPARDLADLGAALRLALPTQGQSFEISYNGRIGKSYSEQVGMLRARYDF